MEGVEQSVANPNIYKPLHSTERETRVLEIQPGIDDTIRASLRTTSVPQQNESADARGSGFIEYEAISYTWGDSNATAEIILDGVRLATLASAVEAIQAFRLKDKPRIVWIDAICINQADSNERAQQVSMMGAVFAHSSNTLVWLGPSYNDTETQQAIQFCHSISEQYEDNRTVDAEERRATLYMANRSAGFDNEYSAQLLNVIFDRRWFGRLWVWQEVALSPKVTCYIGHFLVRWQDLMAVAGWWTDEIGGWMDEISLPSETTQWNLRLPYAMSLAHDRGKSDFTFILYMSSHAEVSEPRDKIFSLLGMMSRSRLGISFPPGLQPDYGKSLRDCMRDATRVMIQDNGLQILEMLNQRLPSSEEALDSEDEIWSSWTPFWSGKPNSGRATQFMSSYNAAGNRPLNLRKIVEFRDPNVLELEGYEISRVRDSFFIPPLTFWDWTNAGKNFDHYYEKASAFQIISKKEFLVLLMAERFDNRAISTDDEVIEGYLEDIASASSEQLTALESTLRLDLVTCNNRRVFWTQDGQIGLGPAAMQNGDVAVVFFGSPLPWMLRQEGGLYRIVGQCYLRGIMNGEVVTERKAEDVEPQTFEIC